MNRRRVVIASACLVILLILVYLIHLASLSAKLDVEIAPTDGTITVNGKRLAAGEHRVKPGNYQIVFSRSGFTTVTRSVQAKKSRSVFSGEALVVKDPSLAGWYTNHQNDQRVAEEISSKNFDQAGRQQLSSVPFIKSLPYINLDPYFRIDYGVSVKYPTDPSRVAIYVYANSADAKNKALDWIKSHDSNSSSLEIIYPNYTN